MRHYELIAWGQRHIVWGTLRPVATLQVQEQVALAPFTTLGVGGSARFFARVASENELEEAVAFATKHSLPLFALGGGSNLVIRDEGFHGLVLHLAIGGEMQMSGAGDGIRYDVPAGVSWDDFVLSACEHGLTGVECLAGIPGLTGGTPVQNVGAYGQEVSQTIGSVRVYDRVVRAFLVLTNEQCCFAYRTSCFNTQPSGRYLVTQVSFDLKAGASAALRYPELKSRFLDSTPLPLEVYHVVREIRRAKGMLFSASDPDSRSAGSFFKNPFVPASRLGEIAEEAAVAPASVPHWPAALEDRSAPHVKLAAAWLVQMAGFPKGFSDGAVGISSRHSLALVNRGGAHFSDVARLRDRIREEVYARFSIRLEQEPVELGPETRDPF